MKKSMCCAVIWKCSVGFFLKFSKILDSFKCPQYYYAGFALFLPNLDLNYFQMRLQIHYMYMKGQNI